MTTAEIIVNKLVEKDQICNSCAEKIIDALQNGINGLFPILRPEEFLSLDGEVKVVWVSIPED